MSKKAGFYDSPMVLAINTLFGQPIIIITQKKPVVKDIMGGKFVEFLDDYGNTYQIRAEAINGLEIVKRAHYEKMAKEADEAIKKTEDKPKIVKTFFGKEEEHDE